MLVKLSKKRETMMLIAMFLTCVGAVGIGPVYCIINELYINFPESTANAAISLMTLSQLVSGPILPLVSRKLGIKNTLVIGAILFAVASFFFAKVTSSFLLILLSILLGISFAVMTAVPAYALVQVYNDTHRREKVLGWYMVAMGAVGAMITYISGWLGSIQWNYAMYTNLLGILVAIVCAVFLPNELNSVSKELKEEQNNSGRKKHMGSGFWLLVVSYFLGFIILSVMNVYISVYVEDAGLGNPSLVAGRYGTIVQIVGLVAGLICGWFCSKLKGATGGILIGLMTVGIAIAYVVPGNFAVYFNAFVIGMFQSISYSF